MEDKRKKRKEAESDNFWETERDMEPEHYGVEWEEDELKRMMRNVMKKKQMEPIGRRLVVDGIIC